MAKIFINGDAVVVTSSVKLEDLRKVQEARPQALVLMGGEDNKEEMYRVAVGEPVRGDTGSIDSNGARFTKKTNDDAGLASITTLISDVKGDVKAFVAKKFGPAVVQLNKIEAAIPGVLEEIAAEEADILANITVVQ